MSTGFTLKARTAAPRVLVLLPLVLLLVIAALWVGPSGTLRNIHWEPPQALVPDIADGSSSALDASRSIDPSQFVAILERPLFSPTRKPPPPKIVEKVEPPPPPDPLDKVRILGVFSSAAGGGAIADQEGKARRILVNDMIGAWTLASIGSRDVTFKRGAETRVLSLVRPKPAPQGPATFVQGGVPRGAMAPAPAAPAPAGGPPRASGLPIPMPDGSFRLAP
ncbi:hypothetical protein [Xylophilus sp. ASV27]|uniref:hypothetical protein n=1 Tax=Xylophilus sp. ASV27 TaxID=2795129 RepID=UPI0018EAE9B0|nr:hypothetical protein [Xylophilus sp. ASV27]